MHYSRGLEPVIWAPGAHTRRREPPEFGIEKLDKSAGGFMIAAANSRHAGYVLERERPWDCDIHPQVKCAKKICNSDTNFGSPLPLRDERRHS